MSAPAHFNVKEGSLINRESVSSTFFLGLVTEKKQRIVGEKRKEEEKNNNNLIMKIML